MSRPEYEKAKKDLFLLTNKELEEIKEEISNIKRTKKYAEASELIDNIYQNLRKLNDMLPYVYLPAHFFTFNPDDKNTYHINTAELAEALLDDLDKRIKRRLIP